MPFASLGLEPRLLKGVAALGYSDPTPIQTQAIPQVLAGRDVVGVAQTGTGKTAAFVLPVLQRTPPSRRIRALVVTPTRELALQIADVVRGASRATGHKCVTAFGGVGVQPQVDRLRKGCDILVACPGRLLDLHGRGVVDLRNVDILVLDEADRMLDMGFWPDVRRIIALLPEKRQNLLFSATMDPQVIKVVDSILTDPVRVEVAPPSKPVDRIEQTVFPVARAQKTDLLVELLRRGEHTRTIVFTRTKHRADRLARQLTREGVSCSPIHGGRSQGQRQTALNDFKAGRQSVLVATDVVARGIDVDEVSHVVNYDMPNSAEDYVHRIGRTARAGASGSAISFLDAEELEVLVEIEKVLGATIACEDLEGFSYHPSRIVPDPDRVVPTGNRNQNAQGGRGGGSGDASRPKRAGRRGGKGRASRSFSNPAAGDTRATGGGAQSGGSGQPSAGKSSGGAKPSGGNKSSNGARFATDGRRAAANKTSGNGQSASGAGGASRSGKSDKQRSGGQQKGASQQPGAERRRRPRTRGNDQNG